MNHLRDFASDNTAGVHSDVLAALAAANRGHAPAYGDDAYTAAAIDKFREHFGARADVYFVFCGTGANVLALAAATRPYQAVICTDCAHIHVDECGATERFAGSKLLPVPASRGKLALAALARCLERAGDEHAVQPHVLSITEGTEYGTVYTPDEIAELSEWAHGHGLVVHMDGARLANAAASLDVELRTLTADAGVDLLSFGGTKNGLMYGEALVCFQPALAADMRFLRKQSTQLASKMRFIAAQFGALLSDDLWRRNAAHANRMARRLGIAVSDIAGVRLTQPVQANAVFASLPRAAIATLQQGYHFYVWNEAAGEVRWMTAFDTLEEDVDAFAAAVRAAVAGY